jgi:hypothetical protein
MTTNDQKFIRSNGTYNISAAMDRATLLQRRSQYETASHGSRTIVRVSRRLWIFASQMAAPVQSLKTRIR